MLGSFVSCTQRVQSYQVIETLLVAVPHCDFSTILVFFSKIAVVGAFVECVLPGLGGLSAE